MAWRGASTGSKGTDCSPASLIRRMPVAPSKQPLRRRDLQRQFGVGSTHSLRVRPDIRCYRCANARQATCSRLTDVVTSLSASRLPVRIGKDRTASGVGRLTRVPTTMRYPDFSRYLKAESTPTLSLHVFIVPACARLPNALSATPTLHEPAESVHPNSVIQAAMRSRNSARVRAPFFPSTLPIPS